MDDDTRAAMLASLADARRRQTDTAQRLKTLGDSIEAGRAAA